MSRGVLLAALAGAAGCNDTEVAPIQPPVPIDDPIPPGCGGYAFTFGAPSRVDDAGDAPERLHDAPRLAFGGASLACAWTDVRDRRAPARARVAAVGSGAPSPSETLGTPATASPPSFRPAIAADLGGLVAVWQDLRTGSDDIFAARSAGMSPPLRVDDGGEAQQFRPDVASVATGGIVVVGEDTRTGERRIRAAHGVLP